MSLSTPPILKTVLIVWWCVFFLSLVFPYSEFFFYWDFFKLGNSAIGVLSYAFVHIDFFHLLGNTMVFFVCGSLVEATVTKYLNLQLLVLGIIIPAMFTLVLEHLLEVSLVPVWGGSGVCYAYLLASLVLFPRKSISLFVLVVPLGAIAITLFLYSFFGMSLQVLGVDWGDQVAHLVHFSGGLVGFFVMGGFSRLALNNISWINFLLDRVGFYQARKSSLEESRLDDILGKISADGIESLNEKEHLFLLKMSKKKRKR
jgi:membrane associated rhomboid family serine protease